MCIDMLTQLCESTVIHQNEPSLECVQELNEDSV